MTKIFEMIKNKIVENIISPALRQGNSKMSQILSFLKSNEKIITKKY